MSLDDSEALPTLTIRDDEERVIAGLRRLQRMVLLHPEAFRSAFQALVAEGRLFAMTDEGKRWQQRIRRSDFVARAQLVLNIATFWTTQDDAAEATPSALVEAIASAAQSSRRDELIERLLRELDGETPHDQ